MKPPLSIERVEPTNSQRLDKHFHDIQPNHTLASCPVLRFGALSVSSSESDGSCLNANAELAGVIGVLDGLNHIAPVRFRRHVGPGSQEEAASFRQSHIRAVLESLRSNRDIYERHIEARLQSDDRDNIESKWTDLTHVVLRSRNLANRLQAAVRRNPQDQQDIEYCTNELDGNATALNTCLGNLNL